MGDVSISEDDLFRFVSLMNSEDPLLYFIQSGDDGPIKIGLSKNIRARLNQLQTSHHESLSVIGICRGGYFEERRLHKTFAAFHMKGEWFVPDIKILEHISEHSLIKVSRVEDQLSKLKNTVAQKTRNALIKKPRKSEVIVPNEDGCWVAPTLQRPNDRTYTAPNRSEPLSLSNDEYRALDALHQAIALVGAKKGLVVFTDVDNPFIEYLNEGDA